MRTYDVFAVMKELDRADTAKPAKVALPNEEEARYCIFSLQAIDLMIQEILLTE